MVGLAFSHRLVGSQALKCLDVVASLRELCALGLRCRKPKGCLALSNMGALEMVNGGKRAICLRCIWVISPRHIWLIGIREVCALELRSGWASAFQSISLRHARSGDDAPELSLYGTLRQRWAEWLGCLCNMVNFSLFPMESVRRRGRPPWVRVLIDVWNHCYNRQEESGVFKYLLCEATVMRRQNG